MIEAQDLIQAEPEESSFRIGVVVELFPNNTAKITFDGEDSASQKQYAYLNDYTPTVGDRVLLAAVASTYVILGRLNYNVAPDVQDPTQLSTLTVTGEATVNDLVVSNNASAKKLSVSDTITTNNLTVNNTVSFNALSISNSCTVGNSVINSNLQHKGSYIGFFNASLSGRKLCYYATDANIKTRLNDLIQALAQYGLIQASN